LNLGGGAVAPDPNNVEFVCAIRVRCGFLVQRLLPQHLTMAKRALSCCTFLDRVSVTINFGRELLLGFFQAKTFKATATT
jgi:hypothetical protein